MNPDTGDVYALRRELIEVEIGATLDMEAYRQALGQVEDATDDERRAGNAAKLVAISEAAARKLQLGERELERRRRRRKASADSRRRNR